MSTLVAEILNHSRLISIFSRARTTVQWFLTGRNPNKLPPATSKTVVFRRKLSNG